LNIKKNFFTESVVRHWNWLPMEVVELSLLDILKRYGDVALRGKV